ncbi:hypothetical protein SSX86_011868 [Deinandra increscens subsp. villosa]|uniref:Uncharacterized protein n=1 Tax=Deinandra increscens subsp. villosa TaxID=3103831 RepID=A0AAP0D8B5_9ASTR
MKYLQNRESFSFSTYSKAGLFSDDEDDGDADGHHPTGVRISGNYQNDYFEISLPLPPPPPPSSPSTTKTDHARNSNEEEFEFCFSFNSSSTIVDIPTTTAISANHPFHHDKPPMPAPTFAPSQLVNVNVFDEKHNNCQKVNKSTNYEYVFDKASTRQYHHGVVSPYVFPPSRLYTFHEARQGFENNRNSTRLDGIKKFMVKLRSIKSILRSSFIASHRLQEVKVKVNINKKASIDRKQIDYGHITTKSNDSNDIVVNTESQRRSSKEDKSSTRVKFKGFSKMLDVIMKNIKPTRRSKQASSKSCPVSIKSSPSHDPSAGNGGNERRNSSYSRDRSIQAAIAHCKKSFGK